MTKLRKNSILIGDKVYNSLAEATISTLKRKQRSITRLFPPFYQRVQKVADKGGIRFDGMNRNGFTFRIHSGTKDDVWYDAKLKFINFKDSLEKAVNQGGVWNKDKTKIDHRKLAKHMFKVVDVQLKCQCPAFLYWGKAWILSQPKYNAKTPPPENRPPDIRNPKRFGAYCKHLEALMKALPFYHTELAQWLKKYHSSAISKMERKLKRKNR